MKLIIDIPEEEFKKLVNPYQHNEIWCNCLKRIVMNGTPFDSVIEDIKREIKDEISRTDNLGEYNDCIQVGLKRALSIIDERSIHMSAD